VKKHLEVGGHRLVVERLGHLLERDEPPDTGVCEQSVDPAESLLDPVIAPVISGTRDIIA